jgi:hypothetical protein
MTMNREHRDMLIDGRLVLVSSYDPSARFKGWQAMQRNKLIYALADAALVVESSIGSKSGTWSGAVEQLEVPPIDRTPYISQRRSPSCLQNARSIHLSFAVKLLSWPKQVAHMLNLPESLDATPPALAPGFARVKLMKPAIRLQMHR